MQTDVEREALSLASADFTRLRTAALRLARQLVVAEDHRAAVLDSLARHAVAETARELRADAHQARANADTATGVVVQLDHMSLRAVSRTGRARASEASNEPLVLSGAPSHAR